MQNIDDKVSVSNLVKDHFPDFYKENGPNFITFVKAYYEWLETERNIVYDTRKLLDYRDIDNTLSDFLEHFRSKYMAGLDDSLVGNQRFFQKHILDLYRSKGSLAGIKLLFRLLYNEDVDVYIPSEDILIGSDGVWIVPLFIEVDYKNTLNDFEGKVIYGNKSGASALVERIESKSLDNLPTYLLYVSNVRGTFLPQEYLYYKGLEQEFGLKIKGSPVTLEVITSSPLFSEGDIVVDSETPNNPKPLKASVTTTYDSVGVIDFDIIDGGTLYSLDAVVSITPGSNTTGIGADFRIADLEDTTEFLYNTDYLADYTTVPLNSSNYGFPGLPTSNSSSQLIHALTTDLIEVGRIDRLLVTNPGTGYDGDVTITVIDPYTSTRGIILESNELAGTDAVITGESITGNGLVSEISLIDSSFGYNIEGEILSLETEDGTKNITAIVNLGGVGHLEGFYDDTKGFLSSNKYLFDGHYYQNFSYEIKSSKMLEEYEDIFKRVMHIAGNRLYGRLVLNTSNFMDVKSNGSQITRTSSIITSNLWNDDGIWMDELTW